MIIILAITNTTLKITIINLQMNGYFIFKWKESLQFNLPNIFTKLFIPRLTYFILLIKLIKIILPMYHAHLMHVVHGRSHLFDVPSGHALFQSALLTHLIQQGPAPTQL